MQHIARYSSDHLEHWGILGMKWGIRRYQNPDGTLTEAGKKRYSELQSKKAEYEGKVNEYTNKAEAMKAKIPKHYLTDTGKAISEKRAMKAARYEGEAIQYQKKINEIDKKISELDPSDVNKGKEITEKSYHQKLNPGSNYNAVSAWMQTYDYLKNRWGSDDNVKKFVKLNEENTKLYLDYYNNTDDSKKEILKKKYENSSDKCYETATSMIIDVAKSNGKTELASKIEKAYKENLDIYSSLANESQAIANDYDFLSIGLDQALWSLIAEDENK